MKNSHDDDFDPTRDLMLERIVDVPVELVWKAWTEPAQVVKWFCPVPWKTIECTIDLRPGGRFYTVMQSPEGETYPGDGCYLEIIENRKLVWTDALEPGYRPSEKPFFTGIIMLESLGANKTKYTAIARHRDSATRDQHETMGFSTGWGTVLDQLVAMIKGE